MSTVRLLLVEDEESLRHLLTKYLVKLQYEVDGAGSAEEALQLFAANSDLYSVCLVDLTLPGMQGDELMRKLLSRTDRLRVLLSSGYPYDIEAVASEYRDRVSFLQKPYLPRQLADQLTRMLGQASRG